MLLMKTENLFYFNVSIPAMGYSTYFISRSLTDRLVEPTPLDDSIENQFVRLNFDNDGKLYSIYDKSDMVTSVLRHNFLWYNPRNKTGNDGPQASGAYIFRPKGPATAIYPNATLTITRGKVVQVAFQQFTPWVKQVIRLYTNHHSIDIENRIGPIDIKDGSGKEIINRFTTGVASGKQFYTDAQGQDMILRTIDHRDTWNLTVTEPIAGNYYPLNAGISIKDSTTQYTYIVDRSRGGSSLMSGQIETMIHRRLLVDDDRGVGEGLNETNAVFTRDYLIKSKPQNGARDYRTRMQLALNQIQFSFGDPTAMSYWLTNYNLVYSPINPSPQNVYIQTLRPVLWPRSDNRYLLRLHHIYGVGEDENLSKPVSVNINNILKGGRTVTKIQEMNLLGNKDISEIRHMQWKTEQPFDMPKQEKDISDTIITLNPMQTRTFLLTLSP